MSLKSARPAMLCQNIEVGGEGYPLVVLGIMFTAMQETPDVDKSAGDEGGSLTGASLISQVS